jgi:shikimate kinase/3-dehydroquinate synthase
MQTRLPLVLSGFMGTGKSTLGRLVAEAARAHFVDLDHAIEQAVGEPLADIFSERGEEAFRVLEAATLGKLLTSDEPRVIAVGGGALLDGDSRRLALHRARVVTLVARIDTIEQRTASQGHHRPLLDHAADRRARIAELLQARAGVYAEAHATLRTDDLPPERVRDALLRLWKEPATLLPLGARSYAVRITHDPGAAVAELAAALAPSATFFATDANVAAATGRDLLAALGPRGLAPRGEIVFPPGEEHKHLGSIELALSSFVGAGADRDALVIGQGGGVVTDMAGFTAATLLRGVRWIAVPTTLLAMVDASVGGKTGVDLGAAKNAVGAFHQPSGVVIGPAYVRSEPERGYRSGLAEVVKTALIGDPALLAYLEQHTAEVLAREPAAVEELVARSVAVKAGVVTRDERETGERAHLNFGHTVGHALESHGGFARLTHGEAVSLGMVAVLLAGVRLGITPRDLAERALALLAKLGLPTDLTKEPLDDAFPLIGLDKKRRGGKVRVVLLAGLGSPVVSPMALDALRAAVGSPPQL